MAVIRLQAAAAILIAAALLTGTYLHWQRPVAGSVLNGARLMVAIQPAGAELNCTLPISALSADRTTGFVHLRGRSSRFERVRTDGLVYIPALHQWAPTYPDLIAPNGQSYVRREIGAGLNAVHVVDSRADRVVAHIPGTVYTIAFTPQGILLDDRRQPGLNTTPTPVRAAAPRTIHLELMDPQTGAIHDLAAPRMIDPFGLINGSTFTSGSETYFRSGNAMWYQAYSASTATATLARYDLDTGAVTTWYDSAVDGRGSLEIVGSDPNGNPIVQLADSDLAHTNPATRLGVHETVLVLSMPHRSTVLNEGLVGAAGVAGSLSPASVTDGDRVWLASDDGQIWLYRPGAAMQLVARITTSTNGPPGVVISGPCIS